jgi:hypothetical protein
MCLPVQQQFVDGMTHVHVARILRVRDKNSQWTFPNINNTIVPIHSYANTRWNYVLTIRWLPNACNGWIATWLVRRCREAVQSSLSCPHTHTLFILAQHDVRYICPMKCLWEFQSGKYNSRLMWPGALFFWRNVHSLGIKYGSIKLENKYCNKLERVSTRYPHNLIL